MENSNDSIKLISALLIGAALGGVLGILFAPQKGSDTRKDISRKGGDVAESLKHKFSELLDSMSEKFQHVKESAEEVTGQSKAEPDTSKKA